MKRIRNGYIALKMGDHILKEKKQREGKKKTSIQREKEEVERNDVVVST